MTDWIDRNIEFPQADFEVIACCDDDVEMCFYRESGCYDFFVKVSNGEVFEATHWQPKPEPFTSK